MMYLVAVSGGVDSVVLLDILARRIPERIIVAHVDHGIRENESAADARFVSGLARYYDVPFVSTQLHLGSGASEAVARELRYDFLLHEAVRHQATVLTAHHLDDLVETIALNLTRGTGWRGLAVLNRPGVERPLLGKNKATLREYALHHRLEWVEDKTNRSDRYLRNRLRRRIQQVISAETMESLASLRQHQLILRSKIIDETQRVLPMFAGQRQAMATLDDAVAQELLGAMIMWAGAARPTRPRLQRALHAIRTYRPATCCVVGDSVQLRFTSRQFTIEVIQ